MTPNYFKSSTCVFFYEYHYNEGLRYTCTLEYDKFDEIFEKGYKYATPLVQEFVKQHNQCIREPLE